MFTFAHVVFLSYTAIKQHTTNMPCKPFANAEMRARAQENEPFRYSTR